MKKFIPIVFSLFMAFILISCSDTSTNPETPTTKGSLNLSSAPSGAAIYINGSSTGKVTPAVITDLDSGTVTVKLTFTGYRDTTLTLQITPNFETSKFVTLSENAPILSHFDNVKLYEVASSSFSGLVLSTGTPANSTGASTDIYFDGINGDRDLKSQHLRSSSSTNHTNFYTATTNNLTDGADSPIYSSTNVNWAFQSGNTANYFFLFDKDSHYSKMVIKSTGQDGPFDRYVILEFYYNSTQNDLRF